MDLIAGLVLLAVAAALVPQSSGAAAAGGGPRLMVAGTQLGVRLAPDNPQAHYQLALALARSGAADEARRHMAEARRLASALVPGDAK